MEDLMAEILALRVQNEELIATVHKLNAQWVPIDYTREFKRGKMEYDWACELPENGEDVLVSLTYGDVLPATFSKKYGFGGFRPEELTAWRKFPKAYKEE